MRYEYNYPGTDEWIFSTYRTAEGTARHASYVHQHGRCGCIVSVLHRPLDDGMIEFKIDRVFGDERKQLTVFVRPSKDAFDD